MILFGLVITYFDVIRIFNGDSLLK
jgi:hypothetical protein